MLNGYRAVVNTADCPKNAVSKNVGRLMRMQDADRTVDVMNLFEMALDHPD